jgi:3-deoxy-manno-octulosonate cytidylyltransferase (CMP-KDO synthetase)
MDSSRFPGKALASDTGLPLVVHVMQQAMKAATIDRVLVAAPDQAILDAVHAHGGEAMMTRADHPNGTSRIAEVAEHLDDAIELIVNVQGDEPEIEPELIDAVVDALARDREAPMATIASPMLSPEDLLDPNVVKVVLDQQGRALLFSRAPIPFARNSNEATPPPLRHVGLYAYRRAFLGEFASWPPSPLEEIEGLEQLRVLEHGRPIAVAVRPSMGQGIDTPEQYAAFVKRCRARHHA